MALDMFMKITGIPGESTDATHPNEIEVLAWSWGATQAGTLHSATGGGAGKVNVQDISFTKYIDKSSPILFSKLAKGSHIADATLTVRKAGDPPVEYLTIKLTKVMLTSLSTGGSGGEDRLTENATLNFAEVDITYHQQKVTGDEDPAVVAKWNIPKNADS